MRPRIASGNGNACQTAELNGNRLVHHLIRTFERPNLCYIESEIDDLDLPPARVIRCMNVLIYFPSDTRRHLLQAAAQMLAREGIIIAGTNGFGIDGRYTVYRKSDDGIVPEEFAFGMENLRTFWAMPWFTIHDNDPEAILLARLIGTIRSDRLFWPPFTKRVDELLEASRICRRGPDGFLRFRSLETPGPVLLDKLAVVWKQLKEEGYLRGVVEALCSAGYTAWENPVGDIAVRPPADAQLH